MLGAGSVQWKRDPAGLVVTLPDRKPCEAAWVLKIEGLDLAASQPASFVTVIPFFVRPDKNGALQLKADDADLHGKKLKCQGHGSKANIGTWDNAAEWVSWDIDAPAAAKYDVTVRCASLRCANEFEVEIAGHVLVGTAPKTASWEEFETVKLGKVEIPQAGKFTLVVRPHDAKHWKAINLASVKLAKAK